MRTVSFGMCVQWVSQWGRSAPKLNSVHLARLSSIAISESLVRQGTLFSELFELARQLEPEEVLPRIAKHAPHFLAVLKDDECGRVDDRLYLFQHLGGGGYGCQNG